MNEYSIPHEKLWEYNPSVQYLFIDFQKAYEYTFRCTMEMQERV